MRAAMRGIALAVLLWCIFGAIVAAPVLAPPESVGTDADEQHRDNDPNNGGDAAPNVDLSGEVEDPDVKSGVRGPTDNTDNPIVDPMHVQVAQTAVEKLPPSVKKYFYGEGMTSALLQSMAMVIATEIGDKTFFIAAIMAMKHSRGVVLFGALGALWVMTVLSAALGKAFPLLIDRRYTSIAASALFVYFGVMLLRDGYKKGTSSDSGDLVEVEEELSKGDADEENDKSRSRRRQRALSVFVSPVVLKSFTLTFLAEWGDRSQITTIALAAAKDVYGVTLGAALGHTICTGLAVLGGRLLAARISEKLVCYVGGLLFLFFASLSAGGLIT